MSAVSLPSSIPAPSPAERKRALEDLLRTRRLQADAPPLRGEDRRLRPLATGIAEMDALLGGGFPRGALSEIHGPASSGRTGALLALLARTTGRGALAALVDPLDRLDPSSAAAAGAELSRLLWLRGPRVASEEPPPTVKSWRWKLPSSGESICMAGGARSILKAITAPVRLPLGLPTVSKALTWRVWRPSRRLE